MFSILAKNTPNQSSLVVVEDHHVPVEDKCPVPGSVPSQTGWSFKQFGVKVEGVPAYGRGLEGDDLYCSFRPKPCYGSVQGSVEWCGGRGRAARLARSRAVTPLTEEAAVM